MLYSELKYYTFHRLDILYIINKKNKRNKKMKIIGKTKEGVLIEAMDIEAKQIIQSVTGQECKELKIGQKIPAIDYAASIQKVKSLKNNYDFKMIFEKLSYFTKTANQLKESIEKASNLDI